MKDIHALRERAKELRCLYAVDSVISDRAQTPAQVFVGVLDAIPQGWRHPELTGARIEYLGRNYVGPGYASDESSQSEPLRLWNNQVGRILVSMRAAPNADPSFLPEEGELLRRIATRISEYLEWKHTELLGERTAATRDHWAWRQRFAEALADRLDPARFGVARIFVGGSTARGDAGPGSDIDLYVLGNGSPAQRAELELWIEGWSLCLAEVALQQTGLPFEGGILNLQWLKGEPDAALRPDLAELALRRRHT